MDQILQAINKLIESRQWPTGWMLVGAAVLWVFKNLVGIVLKIGFQKMLNGIKRIWGPDWEPTREEIRTIKEYLNWQVSQFPRICDFEFNPDKDYVENSKQLLSDQMDRQYGSMTSWRSVWKHTDIVKSITRPVKKRRGYAIIGEPATGKTVEMVKIFSVLAKQWEKAGDCLPLMIFINALPKAMIKEIGTGKMNLRICVCDYLKQLWETENLKSEKIFSKAFAEIVDKHWSHLRLILLFDAVDECPEKMDYLAMVKAFAAASQSSDTSTALVISCREREYTAGDQFTRIRVLPLSRDQIIEHYKRKGVPYLGSVQRALGDRDAMSHLSHYLTNVYFLMLYLEWAADTRRREPPQSIEKLFTTMFERLLRKHGVVRDPTDLCLICFKDALAPAAHLMTTLTMPGSRKEGTPGQPALSMSSAPLLRVLAPEGTGAGQAETWRFDLWNFISDKGSETSASKHWHPDEDRLSNELKHAKEHGDSESLAQQLIQIAGDFEYPVYGKHKDELRDAVISRLEEAGSKEQRLYWWMQMIIGIRAIAWAIRSRLLHIIETEGGLDRFRHQRIREFLTALWLDKNGINNFLRGSHVDNAWWIQTTNMLAGVTHQPRLFLQALLEGGDALCHPHLSLILKDGQALRRTEEPWRLLLASECSRYLPMAAWRECLDELRRIKDGLLAQAFIDLKTGGREAGVVRVLSIKEIGLAAACGILTVEAEWLHRIAPMVRQEDTREVAMATICSALRTGKLGMLQNVMMSTHLLYGSMFCDPAEPVRPVVEAESHSVNRILGTFGVLGRVIRQASWWLWGMALMVVIGFFCTDSGILQEPLFWVSVVALAAPVIHWYFYAFTDFLAFSMYRCFLWPWFWLAHGIHQAFDQILSRAWEACLWLWQFMAKTVCLCGAALRWVCAGLPSLVIRTTTHVVRSGGKGFVSLGKMFVKAGRKVISMVIGVLLWIHSGLKFLVVPSEREERRKVKPERDEGDGERKNNERPGSYPEPAPFDWAEVWKTLAIIIAIPFLVIRSPFALLKWLVVKVCVAAKAIPGLLAGGIKNAWGLMLWMGNAVLGFMHAIEHNWRKILAAVFLTALIGASFYWCKNSALPWLEERVAIAAREQEYAKVKGMLDEIASLKDDKALGTDLLTVINAHVREMKLTDAGPDFPLPGRVQRDILALGKSKLAEQVREARSLIHQKRSVLIAAKDALEKLTPKQPPSEEDARDKNLRARLITSEEILSQYDARVIESESRLGQLASLGMVASNTARLQEDYRDLQAKLENLDPDLPRLSRQRDVLVKRAQSLKVVPETLQFCAKVIEAWNHELDKSAEDLGTSLKEASRRQEAARAQRETARLQEVARLEEAARAQQAAAMSRPSETRPPKNGDLKAGEEMAARKNVSPDSTMHAAGGVAGPPNGKLGAPSASPENTTGKPLISVAGAGTATSPPVPDPALQKLDAALVLLARHLKETDERISHTEQEYGTMAESPLENACQLLKNYDSFAGKLADLKKVWVLESQNTSGEKVSSKEESSEVKSPATEETKTALQSRLQQMRENINQGTSRVDKAQQKLRSALAYAGETISREVADLEEQIQRESSQVGMLFARLQRLNEERTVIGNKLELLSRQVKGNEGNPDRWEQNLARLDDDAVSIRASLERLRSEKAVTDADAENRLQAIRERCNKLGQKVDLVSDETGRELDALEPRHARNLLRAQRLGDEVSKLQMSLAEGSKGWQELHEALERDWTECTNASTPIAAEKRKFFYARLLLVVWIACLIGIIGLPVNVWWIRRCVATTMASIMKEKVDKRRDKALALFREESIKPVLVAIGRQLEEMSLETLDDYTCVLDHKSDYLAGPAADSRKASLLDKIAANIKERIQHTIPVG